MDKTSSCNFLFLFVFLSSLSLPCSDTYQTFLQCLQSKSPQPSQISSILYAPANPSFQPTLDSYVRNLRFNRSTTRKPDLIVTPKTEVHVSYAVLCAQAVNTQLKIRSGGHDYDGISYVSDQPFILLDMFNLRSISIDLPTQTAWVGAGAQLGELYYQISTKSRTLGFPAGVCPTVGVGGHLSGGGYGNMLRKYGLSVDHVIDAKIVDVKGRILDRKGMGEDLFWAIRGGGGASFGVVLSYKIGLVPVPETVTVFRIERTLAQNATEIVYRWQFGADKIDNGLFIRLWLHPVTLNKVRTVRATFVGQFLGDAEKLMEVMGTGFPELGLKKEDCMETSWIGSVLYWANFDNGTKPEALLSRVPHSVSYGKRKSDYLQNPISKDGLELIWKKLIEVGKTGFGFNPYGGRMSEIPAGETPFPHRAGNICKIQYLVNWNDAGLAADNEYIDQIRKLYAFMAPFVSKAPRGAFFSYRDLDIGTNKHGKNSYEEGKVYGEKHFLGNFQRLVKVKTMVDPGNFFRHEQSIPTFQP
ncbi:hypothetical protein Vadar_000566 [Vaccinium darrowii]|uniref:Uncharacterized protein n=1 Tax=Vaccinium darrowii TaxID=229202 RepID=A0ACB7X6R6_9ERIC|nr:hypothetical protein Vadar_000566 [Vaccinium darrowii]